MSLMQEVAALIDERGSGTVDDLLPEIEGATRRQVMAALRNAVNDRLIDCDGRGPRRGVGGGRGSAPATYRKRAQERKAYRPIASVWELGAACQ